MALSLITSMFSLSYYCSSSLISTSFKSFLDRWSRILPQLIDVMTRTLFFCFARIVTIQVQVQSPSPMSNSKVKFQSPNQESKSKLYTLNSRTWTWSNSILLCKILLRIATKSSLTLVQDNYCS